MSKEFAEVDFSIVGVVLLGDKSVLGERGRGKDEVDDDDDDDEEDESVDVNEASDAGGEGRRSVLRFIRDHGPGLIA